MWPTAETQLQLRTTAFCLVKQVVAKGTGGRSQSQLRTTASCLVRRVAKQRHKELQRPVRNWSQIRAAGSCRKANRPWEGIILVQTTSSILRQGRDHYCRESVKCSEPQASLSPRKGCTPSLTLGRRSSAIRTLAISSESLSSSMR